MLSLGISLYILTPENKNHVKYLPHAQESSGSTTSRAVQMESSGNTSPRASQLGWVASGPREAQWEVSLGSGLSPTFRNSLSLSPSHFPPSFPFCFCLRWDPMEPKLVLNSSCTRRWPWAFLFSCSPCLGHQAQVCRAGDGSQGSAPWGRTLSTVLHPLAKVTVLFILWATSCYTLLGQELVGGRVDPACISNGQNVCIQRRLWHSLPPDPLRLDWPPWWGRLSAICRWAGEGKVHPMQIISV